MFVLFRVDAGSTGLSAEFGATAAELKGYVNACEKESQNRNPLEAKVRPFVTVAAIQLVEAICAVSQWQWGLSCLHFIKVTKISFIWRWGDNSP